MADGLSADLEDLKALLQAIEPATAFESLTAALIGQLLGATVAVAKSGFQHGADAGSAGRQQRFLRIECKRYRDTTAFDGRQLLGEIDHAVKADPALEAWILAATREVDEQLERHLFEKGQSLGVPIMVLDWKSHEATPVMAALVASSPAIVSSLLGTQAGALAERLGPHMREAIRGIGRELAAWQIGTEAVRRRSVATLKAIWTDPRESQARFGQIVSGAKKHHIQRSELLRQLDQWWAASATSASPACVTGMSGVGKTWAVTGWLVRTVEELPVTLLIPASAVAGQALGSAYEVKSFLAERLHEVMQVRSAADWRTRLERMLLRPEEEGPVLLVVFDGMNQQPQCSWLSMLKILQGSEFVGRVRAIVTTRTFHFENNLRRLTALVDRPVSIEVHGYGLEQGGEFDQMLGLHGLVRSDLHPDLYNLAQNPRLFELVIRFRDRLVDAGAVTLHRLLWEYGRDTAGEAADKAFSAQEWIEWLRGIAHDIQNGIRAYSLRDLSSTAARPDLETSEVFLRLSELVDSAFFSRRVDGSLELTPSLVAHALGAMAVHLLSADPSASRESLASALEQWLDPISGMDQRPEILRAAVSIALESGPPRPLLGVLTAAWLQTQNLSKTHQAEVQALAIEMPEALLDVIELSHRYTHAASRHTAVMALRGVDRANAPVRHRILERAIGWLRRVSRDFDFSSRSEPEAEAHRKKRLIERIGIDESGDRTLLGESMLLTDRDDGQWTDHLPTLLEGYPLAEAVPALRVAAVAAAVGFSHRAWDQLRWVCLLNRVDPDELQVGVRRAAEEMARRIPEAGAHPQLALRVAELLLHLSGRQEDKQAATALNVTMGHYFSYERDYLANPGHSPFFKLERRHAQAVLVDEGIPLEQRIHKCDDMWLDPSFDPPAAVTIEVEQALQDYPTDKMRTGRYATREDYNFEKLLPVMARCAPHVLANLHRRLAGAVPTNIQARAARGWHQNEALLLHGPAEMEAAHALRTSARDEQEGQEVSVASALMLTELTGLDALAQAELVVEANLKGVPTTITEDLLPLSSDQADQLIARFGSGSSKQQRDVLVLLVTQPPSLSPSAWAWVLEKLNSQDEVEERLAYMVLAAADPHRLGVHLDQSGWKFLDGADIVTMHEASGALIEATRSHPFEQISERLAPWRLLEAVRIRGSDPAEVRIAAERLDFVLADGPRETPDPGAQLAVELVEGSTSPPWYSVQPMPHQDPDTIEALQYQFDEKAQREAYKRAGRIARERIQKARSQGAGLYLQFVTIEDAQALLCHAPEWPERWLTGHDTVGDEFVQRVLLAEGLFLALCEALLEKDPGRGVSLWKALRSAMRTRVTGIGRLPELTNMLFRAPASPEILAARDELLALPQTNTDAALYELALAAQLNGCSDWLEQTIARDSMSDAPWQQQRAMVLRGFKAGNTLPVDNAWPEGQAETWFQEVQREAARLQYFEACARHWWREYWKREDLEEAFAAWVLFTQCADRRALCWMRQEAEAAEIDADLRAKKVRHWRVNPQHWENGADSSSLGLDRRFLRRRTEDMVWPWNT